MRLLGEARSELFHYEVRSTYDTPEVAESRRIVDEARRENFLPPDDPEDDRPWRHAGLNRFYLVLRRRRGRGRPRLALAGWRRATISIPANVTVTAADTAGFQGYFLGTVERPGRDHGIRRLPVPGLPGLRHRAVPRCEERLIETGKVRWRYRDFPLDNAHPFSRLAAHSAACADDQGKYWQQHALIYRGSRTWSRRVGAVGHLPRLRASRSDSI